VYILDEIHPFAKALQEVKMSLKKKGTAVPIEGIEVTSDDKEKKDKKSKKPKK
jgi:hypothetical protein